MNSYSVVGKDGKHRKVTAFTVATSLDDAVKSFQTEGRFAAFTFDYATIRLVKSSVNPNTISPKRKK